MFSMTFKDFTRMTPRPIAPEMFFAVRGDAPATGKRETGQAFLAAIACRAGKIGDSDCDVGL